MEEIIILHTNDLHSHLAEWPKIRRYLLQRQHELSQGGKTVITLDLGDFCDRVHPLTEATDGLANTELLNQIHYDGVTIGNNEGVGNSHDQLNQLYQERNFDVLLANLFEPATGERPSWAEASKIITTKSGTRVGLIALTAAFPLTYGPNGWLIKNTDEILPELLKQVRQESDLIVLMSHLGIEEETRIAKAYPEIDVVLGSHTHHLFTEGMLVNDCLLAAAGKFGQYIGEVKLEIEDHCLMHKSAKVQGTSSLASLATDELEIQRYVATGEKLLSQRVVGSLPETYYYQLNKQPALVDLGLAALKQQTQAEVTILNTGLFLQDLKKGPVTELDLHNCLPHPMHLIRVTLKGADLVQLLLEITQQTEMLRDYPIMGMGFRGKIFGEIKSNGLSWTADLSQVTWLGEALQAEKDYGFVTVDHLLFIPFFPTIAKKGKIEMIFPDFLRGVLGKYLTETYSIN